MAVAVADSFWHFTVHCACTLADVAVKIAANNIASNLILVFIGCWFLLVCLMRRSAFCGDPLYFQFIKIPGLKPPLTVTT